MASVRGNGLQRRYGLSRRNGTARRSRAEGGAITWNLCGVLAALGLAATGAWWDGDPLEEYRFDGEAPPLEYVSHEDARIHRHGLWTVKHTTRYDPFIEDAAWSLKGCKRERVEVYYGTWPKWCSAEERQVRPHSATFDPGRESAPRFTLSAWSPDPAFDPGEPLRVVDLTGGDDITIVLNYWTGGSSGSYAQLIRLRGDVPAESTVDVLWTGQYHEFVDLDGDRRPELIDTDWSNHYSRHLPWKGVWWKVVLDWDADLDRFVWATPEVFLAAANRRRAEYGSPAVDLEGLVAERVGYVVNCGVAGVPTANDDDDRMAVMLRLGSALLELVELGRLRDAREAFDTVDFEDWNPYPDPEEAAWSRERWWGTFASETVASPNWALLVERHPNLAELERDAAREAASAAAREEAGAEGSDATDR